MSFRDLPASLTSETVDRPLYQRRITPQLRHFENVIADARIQIALLVAWYIIATVATYLSGGTRTAMPQLYYPGIILAAFWFGPRGGILAGVIAGFTVGPFMPIDVAEEVGQETFNWTLRLGIFAGVGYVTGLLAWGLRRRIDDLAKLSAQSIESFVRTIDVKSTYTAQHSQKVADYAVQIARDLDLPDEDVERIYWASLLHDVGKIRIPRTILDKPARLDVRELAMMRQHPLYSIEILQGIDDFKRFLPGIRSHHERWDGAGYPDGLAGAEIPLDGRILAVADAFDAMTSSRPYRSALTVEEARSELRLNSGTQFDPEIVEAFLRSPAQMGG